MEQLKRRKQVLLKLCQPRLKTISNMEVDTVTTKIMGTDTKTTTTLTPNTTTNIRTVATLQVLTAQTRAPTTKSMLETLTRK